MTEIKHEHLISEIKNLKLADQLRLLEEVAGVAECEERSEEGWGSGLAC